jgi:hypothetical protein
MKLAFFESSLFTLWVKRLVKELLDSGLGDRRKAQYLLGSR